MKKGLFSVLVCLLAPAGHLNAIVPLDRQYSTTWIAPAYFGPYAYPVPDCSDGRLHKRPCVEVSCDAVAGFAVSEKDYTLCPTFRLAVPLWTDRVNLVLYGDIHEFYKDNAEVREYRRVSASEELVDDSAGNLYYGIDLLVLEEGRYLPAVVVSAHTQTATGDKYEQARHYDAPGYHFILGAGKSFGPWRFSAYGGFLCWQIDRGTQNDAKMVGGKISYDCTRISASAEYGQYSGWEHKGDRPQTIKLRTALHFGQFSPFVYYMHGFRDWPFDLLRVGASYSF